MLTIIFFSIASISAAAIFYRAYRWNGQIKAGKWEELRMRELRPRHMQVSTYLFLLATIGLVGGAISFMLTH